MNRIYETERLLLKVLDGKAAKLVLDYVKRNKEFLDEWEPAKSEGFYEMDYHVKQLNKDLEEIERGNSLRLWIFRKEDSKTERIIGSVGFSNIVRGGFLSCFLGYKLDKDEINKGYITEAIKKGIDIMFNEYGLHRIEANIMPRNNRSLRVVEKLGFKYEGTSPRYLRINNKWEDHVHMVLLNDNM